MTKTSRDKSGKLRIAKGDDTGLGGQFAPDIKSSAIRKTELHAFIDEMVAPVAHKPVPVNVEQSILSLKARMINNVENYETKMASETLFNRYVVSSEEERADILNAMTGPLEKFWLSNLPDKRRDRVLSSKIIVDSVRKRLKDGYNASAIWTDVEPEDEEGHGYTIYELSSEAKSKAENDIDKFVSQNPELILEALKAEDYDASSLGHDLWMTRTRQGVGFWDREQLKENGLGDKLTRAVELSLPPVSLIIDDKKTLQYE